LWNDCTLLFMVPENDSSIATPAAAHGAETQGNNSKAPQERDRLVSAVVTNTKIDTKEKETRGQT
ncbi:hypothetical protein RUM43_002205, partial [Polyplax serrata]